ncbi:MAG: hypothetical protein HYZ08_02635 [Candidatus Kerfeldbacteria bacterium]|nr:hypothetical protein [Candidatus Kerfeldbacteria bacterium]
MSTEHPTPTPLHRGWIIMIAFILGLLLFREADMVSNLKFVGTYLVIGLVPAWCITYSLFPQPENPSHGIFRNAMTLLGSIVFIPILLFILHMLFGVPISITSSLILSGVIVVLTMIRWSFLHDARHS